ncbi:MAG: peptide chain release factor N(5)-glutamine methyltransferase [Clostridia bacterium]|nr:peptide chain release factor N(5)-glutamine methyltransferase [Clostridia bacterium]
MTIGEALKRGETELANAGVPEPRLDAELLLSGILGEPRLTLCLNRDQALDDAAGHAYLSRIARRAKREPLQYIEGETEFMGFPFSVTGDVLIPRPDTEILCEAAIERLPRGGRVFDLGTGSGALAVSIAKLRPDADIWAGDLSEKALDVARQNAKKNGANVHFVLGDCLEPVWHLRYDMIVSNPPYISEAERPSLAPELSSEPAMALFDGADGLTFYRRITREAPGCLNPGGTLLFEIGWQQAEPVSALLETYIGTPFRIKDYGGNWRVCGATLRAVSDQGME